MTDSRAHGRSRPVRLGAGIFVTFAMCALMGACSSYRSPRLQVVSVQTREETDEALVFDMFVAASNDNDVAVPLRQMDYQVQIGQPAVAPMFSATRSPEATLRRLGTQELRIPVVVRKAGAQGRPTGVQEFTFRGDLLYITPGALAEVLFDTGVRRPTVSFSDSGQIDFGSGPGEPVELVARK
jgi:hypothetical protein